GWLVAFPTGPPHRIVVRGAMRVVAGGAGHVALLEALAAPQVLDLVGDVVLLGVAAHVGADVVLQYQTGAVGEGRATVPGWVALRAGLEQALAAQFAGVDDGAG